MFEKRLASENNWLTILPIAIILLVASLALTTAFQPGSQPREAIFSLFMRLDARESSPAQSDRFVIVDIDKDSLERIGPWPWPRTELAQLVNIARESGADNVVLTVPVEGPDPLSPEIVGRYWFNSSTADNRALMSEIARLPSHDVALGEALAQLPSAIAVAENPAALMRGTQGWMRTSFEGAEWITLQQSGPAQNGQSLPVSLPNGSISQNIEAASQVSVSALPVDPDGVFRRARLIWHAYGAPVPATSLSALMAGESEILATAHDSLIHNAGHPLASITVNGNEIMLDRQSATRLYFPQNISVPTVPAWRVIAGNNSWRQSLDGKTVFIGESVSGNATVPTPRGDLTRAQIHVLLADQLADGASLTRPGWSGFLEAGLALLLGVAAVICLLFYSGVIGAAFTAVAGITLMIATWLVFSGNGTLIDPAPAILAMVGAQLGYGLSSLGASVLRDDKVRGAFHGALPATTMAKLQKQKGRSLLDGVRRQVTVLSASIRLPDDMIADFVDKPDEYIQFRAKTNDKLRQTILKLGGTVDYGEDGRLLGYWNVPELAPNHIERACSCALQMIEDMNALARDLQSSQASFPLARIADEDKGSAFEQGHLEIGISSDVCFSGPVGRGARNRYAVIGPSVTLAGTLRERSRLYGPAIVCDETVFTALRHHFAFLDLDTLRINDNPQPRQIYGLVGNPFLKASKTFRRMADTQRGLVNAWRDGNIAEGKAFLNQLEEVPGTHQAFLSLYEQRLHTAELEQKDSDGKGKDKWDGSQQIYL
ncbi:adenylate/guanylate cyclase domain-containing protein [Parvularcula sp. IMCC14364]|uniref:adenylate/guanylate cyclase domain-containing protein n=1 Tax=Parvularcula sp. IMCC14364 TaxID=3067902 RepID=UPI002740BDAD|nr:adenylate/guanylate cyclase domain-containing protein [Parvularcula sp. IMCC14364]